MCAQARRSDSKDRRRWWSEWKGSERLKVKDEKNGEEREEPKNDGHGDSYRRSQTVTSPPSRSGQIKMHSVLRWTMEADVKQLRLDYMGF